MCIPLAYKYHVLDMDELPASHVRSIASLSSLWDAFPLLVPSAPSISRDGTFEFPSPALFFDLERVQRLYEIAKLLEVDNILPRPCQMDGKVSFRQPLNTLRPPARLPSHLKLVDSPRRVQHHEFPFMIMAQISSFAPPHAQRIYIEPFGGNEWTDPSQHRRWITPRSCPDNWSPWQHPDLPNLFYAVFLPDSVSLKQVFDHVDFVSFEGFIAFHLLGRSSDFVLQLLHHHAAHFVFEWPEGAAVYFSRNQLPVPPVVTKLSSTVPEEQFNIKVEKVLPAKKIGWWAMLSVLFPASYVYPVVAGFVFGRTMRFSGCRYSSHSKTNAIMPPSHTKFMHEQARTDLLAGFTTTIPRNLFLNGHTSSKFVQTRMSGKQRVIVNPVSVNEAIFEPEPRDPFPTALKLATIVRSHYFGKNTIILVYDAKAAYKQIPAAPSDLHLLLEADPVLGLLMCLRQQWGHRRAGWSWLDASLLFASIVQVCCLHLSLPFVDDYAVPVPPKKNGLPDWPTAWQLARDIIALSNLLGLQMSKWQIGTRVNYLGFAFDTVNMQLAMVPKWVLNVSKYMIDISQKCSVSLKELSSLAGKLVRLCHVLPTRRHILQPIFRLIAIRSQSANDPATVFTRLNRNISRSIHELGVLISQQPPSISMCITNLHQLKRMYADASFAAGAWVCPPLSLYCRHDWMDYELDLFFVEDTYSIPTMEGWALFSAASFLISRGIPLRDFVFLSDSATFISAYYKGYSPILLMTKIIQSINSLAHPTPLHILYVHTKSNPADLPTRLPTQAPKTISLTSDGKQCARTFHPWPNLHQTLSK